MTHPIQVEICIDSFSLARIAATAGADRLELCGPLYGGGITPSAGLAKAVREACDLPIAMLVRPRIGPFTATDDEFAVMQQDIRYAKNIGMNKVVLGLLHADHTVDVERVQQLVELAYPMETTFHRAFDDTPSLDAAMQDILRTGAVRILTSGGCTTALEGAATVRTLARQAAGLHLLLAGGITPDNVQLCLAQSAVNEVHAALRYAVPSLEEGFWEEEEAHPFRLAVRALKQATLSFSMLS